VLQSSGSYSYSLVFYNGVRRNTQFINVTEFVCSLCCDVGGKGAKPHRRLCRLSLLLILIGDIKLLSSEISDVTIVGALVWQRVNSQHSVTGFVTYSQDGPRILNWRFTGELAAVWI
jgi:hypothetical protein